MGAGVVTKPSYIDRVMLLAAEIHFGSDGVTPGIGLWRRPVTYNGFRMFDGALSAAMINSG